MGSSGINRVHGGICNDEDTERRTDGDGPVNDVVNEDVVNDDVFACVDAYPVDGMAPALGMGAIDLDDSEMEDPDFTRAIGPKRNELSTRARHLKALLSRGDAQEQNGKNYRDLIYALRPQADLVAAKPGDRIP